MKKLYILCIAFAVQTICFGQEPQITEIHYDNSGEDAGEGVEISGLGGTDLTNYSIVFYNGDDNAVYKTKSLSGLTLPEVSPNYGALWIPVSGIQNGEPDGIAFVKNGDVLEFLSYEGTITAIDGPAIGMLSTDIGVSQSNSTPRDHTLQLSDQGWGDTSKFNSKGSINSNLTTLSVEKSIITNFTMYPNPVNNGFFRISSNSAYNKNLEIYSVVGKLVISKIVKSNENIDVSNLSKGIYMVKIEENGTFSTRKLMIK